MKSCAWFLLPCFAVLFVTASRSIGCLPSWMLKTIIYFDQSLQEQPAQRLLQSLPLQSFFHTFRLSHFHKAFSIKNTGLRILLGRQSVALWSSACNLAVAFCIAALCFASVKMVWGFTDQAHCLFEEWWGFTDQVHCLCLTMESFDKVGSVAFEICVCLLKTCSSK